MTLDELLLEWSYRTQKGYPDMDDPSDVFILRQLLEQLDLPTDDILQNLDNDSTTPLENSTDGSLEYDEVIRKKLGVNEIPKSQQTYRFESNTFDLTVHPDDLEIWQTLWEAKPSKKTEPGVETAGVGKGEISCYWLFHHSNSNIDVTEGRTDDDPDLFFNGDGVEIKAYDGKSNSVIGLGRFGKDRENINLLNTAFGISNLIRKIEAGNKEKSISALTWSGYNLEEAFANVVEFNKVDLDQLGAVGEWGVLGAIKEKIDTLYNALGGFSDPKEGAEKMARKFLGAKLARKPGFNKHLVNLERSGFMRFWYVTEEKLNNYPDLLGKAVLGASQGAMKVHFNKVFGN